jgi:hypothetical protein
MNPDDGIRVDVIYPLAEFMKRARLDRAAMRTARRRGLRVRYVGRRGYVSGVEWQRFLDEQPVESPAVSRLSSPR